ncbi:tyrosine-type recombinase/integrase [Lysobacter niastensis]|uniref:Tyrosine-type recombinase/integrase n=1 Tax=Lysobacter niastensis TaxID=380629 RepID=A0ABS0B3E4_9GAMM|nr:site-specific integrase [Lysobacter niastensis]MBF6022853.1 tyrosine-type recombinase/integrase [Lysobacter niastensis]
MVTQSKPKGIAAKAKPGQSSVRLDQETVRNLAAPATGSKVYLDAEIPGFCCQVTYTGTKTFRLRYRKGGKWYSVKIDRWRDGAEGKAPGKRGSTAAQARKRAAELRAEVDRGHNPALEARLREAEQVKAAAGATSVASAYRQYLADVRSRRTPMKESSIAKVEGSFENHILPRLGTRFMSSLAADDIRGFVRDVAKPRKAKGRIEGGPRAANLAFAHLRAFLSWAVKREIVEDNACKRVDQVEVLSPEVKRKRYLSQSEWQAVMAELDEWPYLATRGSRFSEAKAYRLDKPQVRQLVSCEALRISLLTGARKSEVLAMRWKDVDLDRGWWVKPAHTMKSGHEHEIALPDLAVEALRRVRAAHRDELWVFPGKERLDKLGQGKRLKATDGDRMQDVHELWGRIREKLGIPDVRIHDLRHTAASVLISSGASLYEVGDQLGHSQAQTTQRYAHLFEEAKRKTAGRMDAFAARAKPKPHSGRG